jgi:magnesium chelatase subunit D
MRFTEIVGLASARMALTILAVDPSLGGVALAAGVGSGKSTLARAFAGLLPDGTPFVELPVGTTVDRLVGGLDLGRTLATGTRAFSQGLLAQANDGVLAVDGMNLLGDAVVASVIETMGSGVVAVERDGFSRRDPAAFVVVGSYDPGEGAVRTGLLDRIALVVAPQAASDAEERAAVIRASRIVPDPDDDAADELAVLRGAIAMAREILPRVRIADELLLDLANAAEVLGVEGNRADVFAAKVARAACALAGREDVVQDDLERAMTLVLIPRATRLPEKRDESEEPPPPPPPPPDGDEDESSSDDTEPDDAPEPEEQNAPGALDETIFEALDISLPADVLDLPFTHSRRAKGGSRGSTVSAKRGRAVGHEAAPLAGRSLALVPTLVAAAPAQRLRRADAAAGGAAPHAGVLVRRDDIRVKRFRQKAGTLYLFAVDASGSMALNRMREAKGAIATLLQNAYVHRDRVALTSFRGKEAELLLPPSQSVERAKRELDVLPTGGGTPLASALVLARELARRESARGTATTVLVLMTDGRGNIPLAPGPDAPTREALQEEVRLLALGLRADGVRAVVIDTQPAFKSRGDAAALAGWLDARYVSLPNATAQRIVDAVL